MAYIMAYIMAYMMAYIMADIIISGLHKGFMSAGQTPHICHQIHIAKI